MPRLEKLIQDCSKSSTSGQRIASRRLTNLYERLSHTSTLTEEFDSLEQYQEQVAEYKAELSDIRHYVLSECTST